jgi:nucleotide-binding universal stress UspA family protein
MLALSTFRQSDRAVELSIQMARSVGRLVVVYVADKNLARYLLGTDVGIFPGLKEKCEAELLREHSEQGSSEVEAIAARARSEGLETGTSVRIGRFALVCLEAIEQEKPSSVVTTRSHRPGWVKRLFGSPVDYLIQNAPCPVIEA